MDFEGQPNHSSWDFCTRCRLAYFCPECLTLGPWKHRCVDLLTYATYQDEVDQYKKSTGSEVLQLRTDRPRLTYQPLASIRSWKPFCDIFNPLPHVRGGPSQ